jgi:3-dehydroquinate synthase
MKRLTIQIRVRRESYDVEVGSGLLVNSRPLSLETPTGRCLIVSNRKVFGLYGQKLLGKLGELGIEPGVYLIGDGERFKSLRTVEAIVRSMSDAKLGRDGCVIALGGGVVGDVAGFAASVHLRGVRLIQIPTTLLAMIDSSVGGKTGVNTVHGKNMIGTFYQPAHVLIDTDVLATLPQREITAGLCEAIKHGALAGPDLFERTTKVLDSNSQDRRLTEVDGLEDLIINQLRFKASIVAADAKEDPAGCGAASRKILNFGHTFGHALEKSTKYKVFKHGEAVGWGMLFAAELSKKLELADNTVVELLNDVVRRSGSLPPIGSTNVRPEDILDAIRFDKKSAGEDTQWILLRAIGQPVIVPQSEVPSNLLRSVLKDFVRHRSNS